MDAAMVLAAGYGTRLRPLTEELPKPLVPIGDRPLLAHVAQALAHGGVKRVVINTHHLADRFDGLALPLPLTRVGEPGEIRGTAGGVAGARDALGAGAVMVWNGDILADLDMVALAAAEPEAYALLAVHGRRPIGEGTVGVDASGRVARLRGERYGEEAWGTDFVGVHRVSAEARAALPEVGCFVGDVYMPALARGARVAVAAVVRRWDDVGNPGAYLAANLAWLEGREGRRHVAAEALVSPGVEVTASVVGRDAVVTGHGALKRCVVWPGAHAQAPLRDAIVTRQHVVRLDAEGAVSSVEKTSPR